MGRIFVWKKIPGARVLRMTDLKNARQMLRMVIEMRTNYNNFYILGQIEVVMAHSINEDDREKPDRTTTHRCETSDQSLSLS